MPNIRRTKHSTKGPVVDMKVAVVTPAAAPTAQVTTDNLHEETKRLSGEIVFLKEENHLLKEEKDFLREQLSKKKHGTMSKPALGSKKRSMNYSSDFSWSSVSCSDSESESELEKKKKKRRKYKNASAFGKRDAGSFWMAKKSSGKKSES